MFTIIKRRELNPTVTELCIHAPLIAKKAKAVGLTERETAERDALRKEYLADMRASFKQQLDATYVQTADGAKIPYAEYAKLAKKSDKM